MAGTRKSTEQTTSESSPLTLQWVDRIIVDLCPEAQVNFYKKKTKCHCSDTKNDREHSQISVYITQKSSSCTFRLASKFRHIACHNLAQSLLMKYMPAWCTQWSFHMILIKGLSNFNTKKSFIELEAKSYLNNKILMRKKCKWW